eukprot:scaffold6405_cov390-Prasinococcus_capsulatus_cf.AAC.5
MLVACLPPLVAAIDGDLASELLSIKRIPSSSRTCGLRRYTGRMCDTRLLDGYLEVLVDLLRGGIESLGNGIHVTFEVVQVQPEGQDV